MKHKQYWTSTRTSRCVRAPTPLGGALQNVYRPSSTPSDRELRTPQFFHTIHLHDWSKRNTCHIAPPRIGCIGTVHALVPVEAPLAGGVYRAYGPATSSEQMLPCTLHRAHLHDNAILTASSDGPRVVRCLSATSGAVPAVHLSADGRGAHSSSSSLLQTLSDAQRSIYVLH
jgi:hypothetical protein